MVERVRAANGKLLYTRAQKSLGRIIEPRYVAMMNAMMQETLVTGTARKAELGGWPPPARPAPARISATPGSSATPRIS